MMISVSYDTYVCDDFGVERVIKYFTDFTEAVKYWAECSETEDNSVISMEPLPECSEACPF